MTYFCCLISCLGIGAGLGSTAEKPNVVIIFMDDLGYADIGPFGATRQKTPHLDRMAREGMKLTNFYAAPVCSVSRAQLMTGCYGARVSVPGVYFPGGAQGLNPGEVTVAERLKSLGYATSCVGKWHLGDQPEFLPTRQGFDRYFGIPYSNDMQKPSTDGRRVVPLLRNHQVVELMEDEAQSDLVERYTSEAEAFIREHKSQPFFLYLAHNAVHTPIHPGKAFRGRSGNGRFGDWVEESDWSVGRILATLRESGLDRKTLVVFTSDNGPWMVKKTDGGSAGPLRGGKGGTFEGGVRVPTIAWWPGTIRAGETVDTVSGTIDLLPTAVRLAGGEIPAAPEIDGRDLSGVLTGKTRESPREAHYYFSGYTLQAVRQGPWKLAVAPQNEGMGGAQPADTMKNPRLYHLGEDLGEKNDLAEKNPEVVKKLAALANIMAAEIGGQAPAKRRPAGSVQQAKTLYPFAETEKASANPGKISSLKPGQSLPGAASPKVGKTPFMLSMEVETSDKDGVLVAQGGAVAGYAVHLRAGKVVFSVRHGSEQISELEGPVLAGPSKIEAWLGADGEMRLRINSGREIRGKAQGVLPRQPSEGLSVGFDSDQPVAKYSSNKVLTGSVRALKVDNR